MANFIIFLILMWIAVLTEGITTHSVTGCSNIVNLNCSSPDMIHVERITYYNRTDCNQTLIDQQICGQPLTGSDTGLSPLCNGKILCNENLYYTYCPGSKAARVDYRCIQGNKVKHMCGETYIENTNRIFLSTANYPSSPTFTNISPCRCSINGSNITYIEILDLELTSAPDGTNSSIEIYYGDVTYRTESLSRTESRNRTRRLVYNKRLTSTSTKAEINLNHKNINKQSVWIEIQGSSMRVLCNNETESVTTAQSSVTATSSFPSSSTATATATSTSPTTSSSSSSSSSSSLSPSISTLALPSSNLSLSSQSTSYNSNTMETNEKISKSQDYTSVTTGSVVGAVILIVIVIIIIIFISRKRLQNYSSRTKPGTEKIDVNPDYISMDYQRLQRGQPDGGEIDDYLTNVDNDVNLNDVIEIDSSGQTASKSKKDVVCAVVNKPGRESMGSEINSVAPNFALEDDGSHYVDIDRDLVNDSIRLQGPHLAMSKDTPLDETSCYVVNKSDKSLDGESNSVAPNCTFEEDDPYYADIDDIFINDSRQPQGTALTEDTFGIDYNIVNKFNGFSQSNDGRTGSINQDTDHYSSIDINDSPTLQYTKHDIANEDDIVSSDKTQDSAETRSQEDSSADPGYSVVNEAKNIRNSLETDDNSSERIVTENELYVPFDYEASDRIIMENDLYVPLEDTLLTTL